MTPRVEPRTTQIYADENGNVIVEAPGIIFQTWPQYFAWPNDPRVQIESVTVSERSAAK